MGILVISLILIKLYLYVNSSRPSDAYTSVNQANIGSDNGSSPVQCQVIIPSNDESLSTLLGRNISEILIELQDIIFQEN